MKNNKVVLSKRFNEIPKKGVQEMVDTVLVIALQYPTSYPDLLLNNMVLNADVRYSFQRKAYHVKFTYMGLRISTYVRFSHTHPPVRTKKFVLPEIG